MDWDGVFDNWTIDEVVFVEKEVKNVIEVLESKEIPIDDYKATKDHMILILGHKATLKILDKYIRPSASE
ncbi:MAG: hypothetical protein NWF06_06660 [Candidatus Bathyarchaeota archaeon]|nr:hypothetical protein [Candidatus Bathyarchaeum sp.]